MTTIISQYRDCEYYDVNRTYADVAGALSGSPNFSIRTDVYTFENGRSALLLNISGTLPVTFRGATYMFPISLWIPQEYPRAAPIVFVTPVKNMAVRAGQYVSVEGRVYHPYLAGWRETSSILALLSVLQEVFAREPPVTARQERFPPPQSALERSASTPPPIPPLPPELGRSAPDPRQTGSGAQATPPPRPPKAGDGPVGQSYHQANGAPPVPPHPSRGEYTNVPQPMFQHGPRNSGPAIPEHQQYTPQRVHDLRNEYIPGASGHQQQLPQSLPPQQIASPVSPMTPLPTQSFPRHAPQSSSYNGSRQGPPQHSHISDPTGVAQTTWQQHPQQVQPQYLTPQQNPRSEPPKLKPQEDLLTSPFETTYPAPTAEISPPPIPPNPQKDALLQALSQTLTRQIQSTHASNMSAIPPLRAQQAALNDTMNNINHEISQLNHLQALLDSNENILRQAMHDADKILDDAKRREVPAVEEVLVAPTVVAGQLYESVIEERVLEECRVVVGKALDKGRIGGDIWAKQTRSLAREEFLKKALIKKISRGMGLVEDEKWR
ncbi:MAG: hypothetical protein Q9216_001388 [Gyalolechia sp. 2 TL-2023]